MTFLERELLQGGLSLQLPKIGRCFKLILKWPPKQTWFKTPGLFLFFRLLGRLREVLPPSDLWSNCMGKIATCNKFGSEPQKLDNTSDELWWGDEVPGGIVGVEPEPLLWVVVGGWTTTLTRAYGLGFGVRKLSEEKWSMMMLWGWTNFAKSKRR